MNFAKIKNCDIANGVGVRVSLFVSGCTHRCEGCFNPETWDFSYGEEFSEAVQEKLLKMLEPSFINGLTLVGGEPLEMQNQRALLPFLRKVKERAPKKDIWCYTGYTLPELGNGACRARCEATDELLSLIDVLVDGPFVLARKNISLRFRGSENQRIIDMNHFRKTGEITEPAI